MQIQEVIFDRLSDPASASAALIGAGSNCRLYPEMSPNNSDIPYVVFSLISTQPANTLDETFGIANRMVQFSCFARTFAEAAAVRDAITGDLDNVALSNGDIPIVQNQRNGFDETVELFRADVDFLV